MPFLDPSKEIDGHRHKLPHCQQDRAWILFASGNWERGSALAARLLG